MNGSDASALFVAGALFGIGLAVLAYSARDLPFLVRYLVRRIRQRRRA